MKEQIDLLRHILNEIDSDPIQSMQYYTGCCLTKDGKTPPGNCRELLLTEALHRATHSIYKSDDCATVDKYATNVALRLNQVYQHNQQHCWPLHTHHFHPNFIAWVNCPVTCIAEISEYLDKIQKEMYTT